MPFGPPVLQKLRAGVWTVPSVGRRTHKWLDFDHHFGQRANRCSSLDHWPTSAPAASTGSQVSGDHLLRLLFSDGTVGDVDLSAERWIGVLEPVNDPAFFDQVRGGCRGRHGGLALLSRPGARAAIRAGSFLTSRRRLTLLGREPLHTVTQLDSAGQDRPRSPARLADPPPVTCGSSSGKGTEPISARESR
jgi:hypothetical protein